MIKYQKINGYKYRLVKSAWITLEWMKGISYEDDYIKVLPVGELIAKGGYAWDGPSGPTIDTKSSLRGSLWHDIGYQLIRAGVLSKALYKPLFDALLRDTCIQDGMWKWRANMWYREVSKFGDVFGLGEDRHGKIHTAP
jgi:hypothetical protein